MKRAEKIKIKKKIFANHFKRNSKISRSLPHYFHFDCAISPFEDH